MRFGYILGISLQTELMILSFFGIMCTIFDASLLEFNANLYSIWNMPLDQEKFSEKVQLYMKYTLSAVVVIRTFTVHIYLGCYVVMLYPLIFEYRPGLIVPWMIANVIKCLLTSFVSLLAGLYTCMMYKFKQPSCWEFLLTQIVEDAPSVYMFCLVHTFYNDLNKLMKVNKYIDPIELRARRRRARLITESKVAFDQIEIVSRSLDGLMAKIKENEEKHSSNPQIERLSSVTPLNSEAVNFGTTSSRPDRDNETLAIKKAAVSGRSFKISGNAVEIQTVNVEPIDETLDSYVIDHLEEVERVSNLENEKSSDKLAGILVTEDYNTVSDLLNDPNIAIVLNMIANKDQEPLRPNSIQLDDVDISVLVDDAGMYSSEPEHDSSFYRRSLRTPTHEASLQVTSPKFDATMTELTQLPEREGACSGYDKYEPPQRDVPVTNQAKRKSQMTEPSIVKAAASPVPVMPHLEGNRRRFNIGPIADAVPAPQPPSLNQIYKNRASCPKTYRDDGYTQAFFENMHRNNLNQRQDNNPAPNNNVN